MGEEDNYMWPVDGPQDQELQASECNDLVIMPIACIKCQREQCSLHCRWLDDYRKFKAV